MTGQAKHAKNIKKGMCREIYLCLEDNLKDPH